MEGSANRVSGRDGGTRPGSIAGVVLVLVFTEPQMTGSLAGSESDERSGWAVTTEHSAPARRGRAGLTSPAVVEVVARYSPQSARSVRRRASMLMDRLGRYACEERLVEDLRGFVTAHELPPMSLDEVLEEYLWQHIEDYANARDREFDESA